MLPIQMFISIYEGYIKDVWILKNAIFGEETSGDMLTKDFNTLSLPERSTLVFGEGKLIDIFGDNKFQKVFFYKLDDLKIDVIYDKANNRMLDIIAWEDNNDRIDFLKMPVKYN